MEGNCVECKGQVISEYKEPVCDLCKDAYFRKRRVYFNVPYEKRLKAKILGARWEPERKAWYVISKGSLIEMSKYFFRL